MSNVTGAVRSAEVFVGDLLAGRLDRTQTGARFTYSSDYVGLAGASAVASTLPVSPEPYEVHGVNLHSFFANLLPEGLRLDAIASRVKTSRDDRLTLLLASGEDTIGDVSVRMPGVLVSRPRPALDLSLQSFATVFEQRYGLSFDMAERVTIAGVQEKVSASRLSAPVRFGAQESIIKLNLAPERRPRLIENEHFFMNMAHDCGLKTAACAIITDCIGDHALAVARFDRTTKGQTQKLHQEDACQFLGLYPDHKYDVSLQQVSKALGGLVNAPTVERLRLLELFAYSYLIGNGDLHAKNISILRGADGIVRLSPAYDLLSTWPYRDFRMAVMMDGRDRKFNADHFVRFGARFAIKEKAIRAMLERLYAKSAPWLDRIGVIGFSDDLAGPLHTVIGIRRQNLVRGG